MIAATELDHKQTKDKRNIFVIYVAKWSIEKQVNHW